MKPARFDSWPPAPTWSDRMQSTLRRVVRSLVAVVIGLVRTAQRLMFFVVFSVLVMIEPLVRIVLVPLATLSTLMAVVFGFAMHAPHFHPWGMLVFGVGLLWLYWLYLLLIHWIARGIA